MKHTGLSETADQCSAIAMSPNKPCCGTGGFYYKKSRHVNHTGCEQAVRAIYLNLMFNFSFNVLQRAAAVSTRGCSKVEYRRLAGVNLKKMFSGINICRHWVAV